MATVYSRKILERVLSEKELSQLEEKYQGAKKVFLGTWQPTEEDWSLYRRKATLQEFQTQWGIRKETVLRKLGKMYFLSK